MKYFCWQCSHEHDDEYEVPTPHEVGPVCPTCQAKREEAQSLVKAALVAELQHERRVRNVH